MTVYSKLMAFVILAITPWSLSAQDLFNSKVTWSEGIKMKTMQLHPEFVGMYKKNLVAVSSGTYGKVLIDEYNAVSLTAKDKFKVDLKYEDNKLDKTTQFIFGEDLVFITNYRNKSAKTKHFFIQKYLGNGKLGKPKLIGSMGWEDVPGLFASKAGTSEKYEAYNSMKTVLSADKKHLVVMYPDHVNPKEGEENKWHAILYNENLDVQWSYEFSLPNSELYLDKVVLSDDGSIYCSAVEGMVAKTYKFAYVNALQGSVYGEAYHLLIVDGKNQKNEIYDLEMKEKGIIAYSMNLLGEEVVFYGLTGSGITENLAEGVFFKKINKRGEEIYFTEEKFTEAITSHNEDTNPKTKTGSGARDKMQRDFRLDDIVITAAGDVIFFAEQFNFYMTYQSSGGVGAANATAIPNYVHGDIIAISCSADGNVKWMNRIVKYQHSTTDAGYFSSYFPMAKGDNMHLLFNDTEYYANYEELKDADSKTKRKAKNNWVTSEVIIHPAGTFERNVIIDEEDKDNMYFLAPASAVLQSDNVLLSVGMHRKKKGLLSYELKQVVGKMDLNR
jgi:hypothetical protein